MLALQFRLVCLGCTIGLFLCCEGQAQVTIINNNNYYVAPSYGVVYDAPYRNNYHGYRRDLGYGFVGRRSFYRGHGSGYSGSGFYDYDRYRALQYYPPRKTYSPYR